MSALAERDELLERSAHLAALGESLRIVLAGSGGQLVLVGGEAGAGKTALLQRCCDDLRSRACIFWGTCDALLTPGPLGPLFDIAEVIGGELERLVTGGARPHEVVGALIRELDRRAPTILVLEDLHWADEATLDVLRLLGRRLRAVQVLVLVSYRDDELEQTHPLRLVLGELSSERAVGRLEVAPLSAAAVATLAATHALDPVELHRRTNGNAFFVTEVLAAGTGEIPPTVRDAVLARAARLTPPARALLDAVAVVSPQAEVWLLESIAGKNVAYLGECLTSGMLRAMPAGVAFRHELARLACEQALTPDRRVALHRMALAALADPPNSICDLARLADHAEGAQDGHAVLRFAPAAAARAAELGAHREAAAQYARALRFAALEPTETQAELLQRRAEECGLTDQSVEAIDAAERALAFRRQLGDRPKEAELLSSLSALLWCPGRVAESDELGVAALTVLEDLPPGRDLATAYSDAARRCMNAEDAAGALDWGKRAIDLAQRLGDVESEIRALTCVGTTDLLAGRRAGIETAERSIELAQAAGLEDCVAAGYVNIAWATTRTRTYELADQCLTTGLAYCNERGLDLHRRYLLMYRARAQLDQGRWSDATQSAEFVLREPSASVLLRILPLVVQALVRARQGATDVGPPLDTALTLAGPTGQLQGIGVVAAARAEAAWLQGDRAAVATATDDALELALRQRSSWLVGELSCWRRRAGIKEPVLLSAADPWTAELEGDCLRAARLWRELGCPYDAALALAHAEDEQPLRQAHHDLQALAAAPAAAIVARQLRERGARDVPRGPRAAARSNAAGLSARELEVLELVATGARNAEIARRLFISDKTAGHHVSAILRKLGVSNRGQASAAAVMLGLTDKPWSGAN